MDKNFVLRRAVQQAASSGEWANGDFDRLEGKPVPASAITLKPVAPVNPALRVTIRFLEFSQRCGGRAESAN